MPQPTAGQLAEKYTKKTALMQEGPLLIEVYCLDARAKYGRIDVQITPTKGTGERWVSSERLTDIRPRAHN